MPIDGVAIALATAGEVTRDRADRGDVARRCGPGEAVLVDARTRAALRFAGDGEVFVARARAR